MVKIAACPGRRSAPSRRIFGEEGEARSRPAQRPGTSRRWRAPEALAEQVWDAPDIPVREIFFGRPAGSAMPLEATSGARRRTRARTASGLLVQYADPPTAGLHAGASVKFTFHWPETGRWENADFVVDVA
jgi:hypothetical protein